MNQTDAKIHRKLFQIHQDCAQVRSESDPGSKSVPATVFWSNTGVFRCILAPLGRFWGVIWCLQQQKQVTSVFPPRCKMPPPLNSRSSTQKAPRDTLVYLRFGSFLRRFFFRYQRIILKSLDFSAQIDFFMNFCPRRATKLRSL